MRECRAYRFTQLMETDCVPAKADWVTDLDAICRREPFWIAGAFLHDLGAVNGDYAFHLNGNALYATGDQGFQEFLESTFIPARSEDHTSELQSLMRDSYAVFCL